MRRIRVLGLGLALLVLPLIPSTASAAEHARATVVVAYGNDGYAYYGYRDRDGYYRYRDRDDYYWRHHRRYRDRDDYYWRRHHRRYRWHRDRDDDWR
jgi:hypothetical protein